MKDLNILEDYRQRIVNNIDNTETDVEAFKKALYQNGIGFEETLHFLYFSQPDSIMFKNWLAEKCTLDINEVEEITEDILTANDLLFFKENGYVIVKNTISKEDCLKTQEAILNYIDATLNNPSSWYKNHQAKKGLMVLFTKHPTLQKNRSSAKIRKAYELLYQTKQIYKTFDKVSFNPPETESYKFRGSHLHWDMSLNPPFTFVLQGLLYLTDVLKNSGAFYCVPGFHNNIENWLNTVPKNINPQDFARETLRPIPVIANAGDFIIWHHALPHCATANTSNIPRMVQYLTYLIG